MKAPAYLQNGEIERYLRRRLMLLMSVDVVDSAKIKWNEANQNKTTVDDGPGWLQSFGFFLTYFPKELRATHRLAGTTAPRLWKSIGDELVFVAELKKASEADAHIEALRHTLRSPGLREYSKELRFKATAWLAGIPVGNVELPVFRPETEKAERAISEQQSGSEEVDMELFECIGPSVDLGFRLSKLSTPRHLTVSLELAWLLLRAKTKLSFLYSGRQPLKGIMEDTKGVPHVWVDIDPPKPGSVEEIEEKLMKTGPADHADLMAFCKKCIEEHGNPRFLPFIEGDEHVGTMPDSTLLEKHTALRRETFRRIFQENHWRDQLAGTLVASGPSTAAELRKRMDEMMPPGFTAPA